MDVEFVDQLPGDRSNDSARRAACQKFAAELRRQPGRWAVYPFPLPSRLAARTMASRITNGKIAAFAEGFRGTARGDTTYVRYEKGMP